MSQKHRVLVWRKRVKWTGVRRLYSFAGLQGQRVQRAGLLVPSCSLVPSSGTQGAYTCLCVHSSVCAHLSVCVHARLCVCTCLCVHTHMYVHTHLYVFACVLVCLSVHVRLCVCACLCMHTYLCVRTCMLVCVCAVSVCAHIYAHLCKQVWKSKDIWESILSNS